MTAMFQCLEAVEQNNPKLLAQVDTVGVGEIKSTWLHLYLIHDYFCSKCFVHHLFMTFLSS